jgi:hypothetical protein
VCSRDSSPQTHASKRSQTPTQTVGLLLFAQYVMVAIVITPWYGFLSWHTLGYTTVTLLALVSHSRAQFSDPGAVPFVDIPASTDPVFDPVGKRSFKRHRQCKKCQSRKPWKASHCSTCGRCILQVRCRRAVLCLLCLLRCSCVVCCVVTTSIQTSVFALQMDHRCSWVINYVAIFNHVEIDVCIV